LGIIKRRLVNRSTGIPPLRILPSGPHCLRRITDGNIRFTLGLWLGRSIYFLPVVAYAAYHTAFPALPGGLSEEKKVFDD